MIIGGTINLGGCANRRYKSNEFNTPDECIEEIRVPLLLIREPRVTDYIKRVVR